MCGTEIGQERGEVMTFSTDVKERFKCTTHGFWRMSRRKVKSYQCSKANPQQGCAEHICCSV